MSEKEIKVRGIPSGDGECWCFLVTQEDFKRIRGREPDEFDEGRYAIEGSPYRYMLRPHDLIPEGDLGASPKPLIDVCVKVSYPDLS